MTAAPSLNPGPQGAPEVPKGIQSTRESVLSRKYTPGVSFSSHVGTYRGPLEVVQKPRRDFLGTIRGRTSYSLASNSALTSGANTRPYRFMAGSECIQRGGRTLAKALSSLWNTVTIAPSKLCPKDQEALNCFLSVVVLEGRSRESYKKMNLQETKCLCLSYLANHIASHPSHMILLAISLLAAKTSIFEAKERPSTDIPRAITGFPTEQRLPREFVTHFCNAR